MTMPRFREFNPLTTALVGLATIVVVLGLCFQIPNMAFFAGPTYHAVFTDAGDMSTGDQVWVAGVQVGKVTEMELDSDKVGDQTRAAIKTSTLLGKRVLGLTPDGAKPLAEGATIPESRTQAPYNIDQSLEQVTQQIHDFDKPRMSAALNTFADTFADTPENLRGALVNVKRFSETISSRDQALRELLSHTNVVSGVLNERTEQFQTVLTDGNELLLELRQRHEAITRIFKSVSYVTDQIAKFNDENKDQLGPVLHELNGLLDVLRRNDNALQLALSRVGGFIGGIGEGVSSGPSFSANVLGIGMFNYTDLLRQLTEPTAPRVPSAPGIPGGGHLPDPLAGGPGTAAGGPPSNPTAGPTSGLPALPGPGSTLAPKGLPALNGGNR
jgi:phospholipid/cholesterol/gamma-HCH transport system substrate-binding protein